MRSIMTIILLVILVTACQPQTISGSTVTIIDGDRNIAINTSERVPANILAQAGISLSPNDILLYQGRVTAVDQQLPVATYYTLQIRRAVQINIISPGNQKTIESAAFTVGQALSEAGIQVHAADRIEPAIETPITEPLTITYQPAKALTIIVGDVELQVRSSAENVGQALTDAGIPLIGLDFSIPLETEPFPADGVIRLVHVDETVALTQRSLPFGSRMEGTADLELDQTALLQPGEAGLAIGRTRIRTEDGKEVSRVIESETIVRPALDRVTGFGTKIVERTITIDGQTFTYWRSMRLFATSYSPCRSATPDGGCMYGTSSGLPVQRGTVAMVYSWYLLLGFERLYIPGYGFATVGDVGGGCPPAAAAEGCPAGGHTWIDLGWTDEEYQPMSGWMTVYFLVPVPANIANLYIMP